MSSSRSSSPCSCSSLDVCPAPAPAHRSVTFCALQVEIAEGAPDLDRDLCFNRRKTLEEIFENCFIHHKVKSNFSEEQMASRRRSRGRRQMGDITVKTLVDFPPDDLLEREVSRKGSKEASKEASPHPSQSKESTPASTTSTSDQYIKFISGNPFVEVTKGVLHLFKEKQVTSLEEGVLRSHLICMLGVPAKIKTADLLQFTAPCHSTLQSMRIIQDSSPNQYMVLLKFRSQESADEFYEAFNGQRYNSLESDVCSLVYVSKVETCKESEYYPLAGYTELPLCSICLERMDESISTMLTILCNHTFHRSCLAQWEDSTCPVCRYVQTPELVAEQRCSDCQSSDDLWICLVCGYVGCGRYVGGHSHAHFMETQHCYTMELGQNRVWDYVGDNFVHRLVQTDSADGKLVEAEGIGGRGMGYGECGHCKCVDGVAMDNSEKVESVQLEYTYLLTSQLEAQRRYYDEKMARIEEQASRDIEEVTKRTRMSVEESHQMEAKIALLSKEKAKNDQKVTQLNARISKLVTELKEEKQINESLTKNQRDWQVKLEQCEAKLQKIEEKKDKEIQELREELRDVMFYLQAQSTIENSPHKLEIQEGEVSIQDGASGGAAQGARPTGKSRKKKGGR